MINKNTYKLGALAIALSLLIALLFVLATQPPSPDLHLIVGEANYGTVPADGALVTVTNERTLEELYDTVGPSGNSGTSGWFLVDLSEMSSGYREGDQIRVVIRGVGGYSEWYGINSTGVDNTTVSQIVNVMLYHDISLPETIITGGPLGTITYNDVTFTWTGSDDATPAEYLTYSYMLEGYDGSWSAWVSNTDKSYYDLSDGEYTFKVKARDLADNTDVTPAERPFTVQVTGPTLFYSPTSHNFGDMLAGQTDSTTFEIWNSGTETLSYTLSETCTWASIDPASGSSTGEHDVITVTIDTTGLSEGTHMCDISIASNGGSGIFAIEVNIILSDTIPPEITDIQLFPFHPDAGRATTISATVTDNVAVADVFLNITYPDASTQNFSIFQNKTGNTYYCKKTYTQLGEHSFTIFAVDTSNNKNTSSLHTFEVEDKTPPSISSIETHPIVKDIDKKVNISATVTDNVAVADVFLNITYPDASTQNFSIFQNKTDNTYYCNRTYTQLGEHSFTIFAVDTSNNGNSSDIYRFNMGDFTPPSIKLVYPLEGENVSGIVTIKWNATDNHYPKNTLKVTLKYSSDGGKLWHLIAKNQENDGEYKWNTTDLIDGKTYRVMVKVNDSKNNEGSNISGAFTVDNTAPSIALKKPQINYFYLFDREVMPILRPKAVVVGRITVTANATDTLSGVDKVEFFIDGVSEYIDTVEPYEWEWDETAFFLHTLKVVATDEAGNTVTDEIEVSVYII